MARNTFRNLTAAIRAPFNKRFGLGQNNTTYDHSYDNGFRRRASNAADTADVIVWEVDGDDIISFGREATKPMGATFTFNIGANGSIGANNTFFIADRTYWIQGISEVHATLGTDAAAVTAVITRDTGTTAPGGGTSLMTGSFNLKATINTVQNATLNGTVNSATDPILVLNPGDRLCFSTTGVLTALAGVCVTVYMSPGSKAEVAQYYAHLNADIGTQTFFVANRDYTVKAVYAIYGTAFAAAVTLDITHETTTGVPGAGLSILAGAMAADGVVNTLITPALNASVSRLYLPAGDRLSTKFSATTTGADVCVVVVLQPVYKRKEITFQLNLNAQMAVAQNFWIADRDYQVEDVSATFGTAAGGVQVLTVTIDKGTTAPGAGNKTDASGFNLNATANTVQFFVAGAKRLRQISAGDRLGLNWSGAAQASAKLAVTVSLSPTS